MSIGTFQKLLQARRPYYIQAPDFARQSAGIRVMHLLCHLLNRSGEEAYILAQETNPCLQTPLLTPAIEKQHQKSHRQPIAVYPEIVFGNPLCAPSVARLILNHPGLIGGPNTFPKTDLLFFYNSEYANSLPDTPRRLLQIPTVDTAVFNNLDNPADNVRSGILLYPGRYTNAAEQYPELFRNGVVITYDWPESHTKLAALLRQSECLYCFSNSAIAQEAVLCGCVVIFMETSLTEGFLDIYRRNQNIGRPPGMAIELTDEEISRAKCSIPAFLAIHRSVEAQFIEELSGFITQTQNSEAINYHYQNTGTDPSKWKLTGIDSECFASTSDQWLSQRSSQTSNSPTTIKSTTDQSQNSPTFHLIIRLNTSNVSTLADTLDSLGSQHFEYWHLDILSTLPSPPGLDEIPCIDWHVLTDPSEAKLFADHLVTARSLDLVLEIPPGAILDPLYLWRLADEANRHSHINTFFTDDNIYDENGVCTQIRFKPGVNPEWLRSTDISGPICVRRDAWLATGGASHSNGSPWFSQLLRIVEKFGWSSIKHIPDVLISYSGVFPSDAKACLLGLLEHLKNQEIAGEIVPVTGQSWSIRYPLQTTPKISIAIISRGQLDLLSRCLNSIIEKTSYPNFEIIIAITDEHDDPELDSWLTSTQQTNAHITNIVKTLSDANHASRCNAAVKVATNEFVLLIREEAVIIQDKWLEELVRTCLQPDIAAVAPCLISPGTAKIQEAGLVLGLQGPIGSPYQGEAKLGEKGELDQLRIARDVSALSGACLLIRNAAYLAAGGMDEADLGNDYADADLCLKVRSPTQRLIYQPFATVVYGGATTLDIKGDNENQAKNILTKAHATQAFTKRWLSLVPVDPFWNPNLSLAHLRPTPETDYVAQWQYLPSAAPRILACTFSKGESFFRIDSALSASRKAGLASECYWPQDKHEPSAAELLRLAPDSIIVQHYFQNKQLAALQEWSTAPGRPFIVFTIDDLMTNMAESNSLRLNIPANCRTRLKYALARCDRMVVSTDFLAEHYRHLIADIRVVPNRLEKDIWLPLQSRTRTGKKPRIGWAGGRTHKDDLQLLKEVIEQTRGEADWIFFGMCPENIRPLLTEYHPYTSLADYPSQLAALNLDIAVAPLAQTPFNQAKSNLRLLEYGILGIPVVCTDIDPYRGSPACCVANTTAAWTNALRERIHDPKARKREGKALRQWVHQHYLQEDHLEEWLNAHLPS